MRLTSRFHNDALWDLWNAVDHFDAIGPSVGDLFRKAVDDAIDDIEQTPKTWPEFWSVYRIRMLRKFRYGLIYGVGPTTVQIMVLADLRRSPEFLKKQLKRRSSRK